MRLLLDTHVYLWWLQDHPKLSENGREKIIAASEVYISSASIWEASIKIGIGKLDVDINELLAAIAGSGFQELPITTKHASMVMRLPNIHRDPFDRILIAQSMCEPIRFLTADEIVIEYSELAELV